MKTNLGWFGDFFLNSNVFPMENTRSCCLHWHSNGNFCVSMLYGTLTGLSSTIIINSCARREMQGML